MMNIKSCIISTILLALSLSISTEVQAKSYTIPTIRVEVSIQPDGSIRITEYLTYKYEGEFSWADYRLPFKGFTAIRDIQVGEKDTTYLNKNSEQSGTFLVQRGDGQIRVKWFYEAEDEQRTFTISYTLEGAIIFGPEWAEFFWNYLGSDREKDTDSLQVALKFPQAVVGDSLYTWKRGPRENIMLQNTSTGYTVTAKNIDDDEFVKIRIVFPRSIFNQDSIATNDSTFTLAQAQANEESHQELLKRNERYAGYAQQFAIIISILSIAAFILLYRKYGKRHPVRASTTETIMIPGRLKPAVAGWLLQGKTISSVHLMATLLDLARRKYFVIEEQEPQKKWFGDEKKIFTIKKSDAKSTNELTPWEASLFKFVEKQIEKGNNQIDELFSESSHSSRKWFKSWKNELNESCKSNNWYDRKSRKGMYWNIAAQIILGTFAILAAYWAGPVGIIPIAITLVFLVSSIAIERRTPEGEKTYARWNAYKEGLKNAKNHSIGSNLLDKHFIYAVAFGLSKKNIETVFAQCDEANIAFYWFVFYPGSTQSPADIAGTFSTLSATGAGAFPGAAASGAAGASAGTAGGGASTGAG